MATNQPTPPTERFVTRWLDAQPGYWRGRAATRLTIANDDEANGRGDSALLNRRIAATYEKRSEA